MDEIGQFLVELDAIHAGLDFANVDTTDEMIREARDGGMYEDEDAPPPNESNDGARQSIKGILGS